MQFDGHRIDTAVAVVFKTPEGDEVIEAMYRIWLLVIIDVATRAILGHHLCLNKEYSSGDVLRCIRNAVVPWKPKTLTIPGAEVFFKWEFPLWFDGRKRNGDYGTNFFMTMQKQIYRTLSVIV